MAITRAQQYRQMLEDGGMLVKPSVDGKRPGYRSARAQESQGRTKNTEKSAAQQDRDYQSAAFDSTPSKTNTTPSNTNYTGSDYGFVVSQPKETYETEAFDITNPQNPSNTLQKLYDRGVEDGARIIT